MLVSSGLDHTRRGFERFMRECFEELQDDAALHVELVKASGVRRPHERVVPTLRRDRATAQMIGRALDAAPYRVEAVTFGLSLQPTLLTRKPDVIYLCEWDTARLLALIRMVTRQRFKLVFHNAVIPEGFGRLDLVQELSPPAYEYVLKRGADPICHTVLPPASHIPKTLELLADRDRRSLRVRLRLPVERKIVISVAALNHQKRLDYVIEELAAIRPPRPFLLLVGQKEPETPLLCSLADDRLGSDGYSMRSVAADEMDDLYRASDAAVLASLYEGLPRALIEASAFGLPCLVHEYEVTEFALGPHRHSADLTKRGALAALISGLPEQTYGHAHAVDRHRYAYEQFSWDRLRPKYVDMLRQAAGRL